MRLDSVVRRVLPAELRQSIGGWSLTAVSHNIQLLKFYNKLLYGYSTDKLRAEHGHAVYSYQDHEICSPLDGAGVFIEIFNENVYDGLLNNRKEKPMRLDGIARKVLPARLRQSVGCWSLNVVSHNERLLKLYVKLLHGYAANNISVEKGHVSYLYQDEVIKSPVDGTGSFLEVFKDNVYDGVLPKTGDVAIDVGAYVGMWSVKTAIAVGWNGRVVAIEPMPENVKWLADNVAGLPVVVLPIVASDKNGTERLYISKATTCSSLIMKQEKYVDVEAKTIDRIVIDEKLPHVDLIKIDAEGAELKVLQGAIKTLTNNNVKLAIASYHETAEGVPEVDELVKFLEQVGYVTWHTDGLRRYTFAVKCEYLMRRQLRGRK